MVGGMLLLLCLFVHMCLGMRSLYRRNTLQLSGYDLFQLLLGLLIPILMIPHMVSMILMPQLTGNHASYAQVLTFFWVTSPWSGLMQVLGLLSVWLHGCMGLFVWMRMQSWWKLASVVVYPTVVLLPALALLGFVESGKAVIEASEANVRQESGVGDLSGNSTGIAIVSGNTNATGDDSANSQSDSAQDNSKSSDPTGKSTEPNPMATIKSTIQVSMQMYLALLALTLVARFLRLSRSKGKVQLVFAEGETIEARAGATVLEISRLANVAHASLCGGKGRCGTCQVEVLSGLDMLTPKTTVEIKKLKSIGAGPEVRLACQARALGGSVVMRRMLPGYVQAHDMPPAAVSHDKLASAGVES